ncbi:hypothetical protein ACFYUR_22195 [Micromonospora haikouensis]|uniref:hypothetical protein n=1 Tax=Micromonospora haikouensis TaxID=686309 RepID=UPI00367B66A0
MTRRARRLNVRGNIALTAALAIGLFLAAAILSGGRWTPLHTWFAVALAGTAGTATACYALASRRRSPRGESPQVTHPGITFPLTPSEVRK